MTTPRDDAPDQPDATPLGGAVAEPDGPDEDMAGPVYPPEETEPDAHS
jgi:hypothetical protein